MSWGTTIYPKIEDFATYNISAEQLQNLINGNTIRMSNIFVELRALSLCTPYDTFGKDAYDKICGLVDNYFDEFTYLYKTSFDAENVSEMNDFPKKGLLFDNTSYASLDMAKMYLSDLKNELSQLKGKILGLCLATPIDITPRDQTQYVDGHEEPLYYLEVEFNSLEEAVEDVIHNICVTELIIKYWDGHETY